MRKDINIKTRNLDKLMENTSSLYEAVYIIAKRAKQINSNLREEINHKVEEFVSNQDDIREVFENHEQTKISKYYERLPKPTEMAIEEFLSNDLTFRYKEKEEVEI